MNYPITRKSWNREQRKIAFKIRKRLIKDFISKYIDTIIIIYIIGVFLFFLGRFVESLAKN